jgi:adenine-specific DNA-methyltransferase
MAEKVTPVRSLGHEGATRPNIPTAELESFVRDEEKRPTILRYLRDPTLDPQLVWKGKDEQDGRDLEVPAVPIYIQETIDPLALIEDLRSTSEGRRTEQQLDFFGAYSDRPIEEKVDFYRHSNKWSNRMILGDSLLVMTSLAEKEGLKGQIQTIYIDPPYGIEFGSNWQVSTRKRDVTDGRASDLTRQPEQIRAYRDTWELGIHSYLSYVRDRLLVSRELLTDSGSVFVQIGNQNVHLVRAVLDEVFGSANAVNTIVFKKTSSEETDGLSNVADYLVWYAKDVKLLKTRPLLAEKVPGGDGAKQYTSKLGPGGRVEPLSNAELSNPGLIPSGWRICRRGFPITSQHFSPTRSGPFEFEGKAYSPGPDRQWSLDPDVELPRLVDLGRIYSTGRSLNAIVCLDEMPTTEIGNVWTDTGTGSFTERQVYAVQTSEKVVQRAILLTTDPGDLVVDPTCGSGTTAVVAETFGRRWITIDTSRVALSVARARLMARRYPWYELAAYPDVRRGFQWRVAPHKSLSDIARGTSGSGRVLVDQPIENKRIVRVSGPFTVESLSPHRVLHTGPEDDAPEIPAPVESIDASRFVTIILDNLRRAGVQNTKRDERLEFSRLDPYPGVYVQAVGEYVEGGKTKTAAIAIGPEFGTVGPELVRDAAKEAVKIADLLVVCGFAFDPMVGEEASSLGRLTILRARMNPDLAMGDELLKKTGTGNLFMVFGEPDIAIHEVGRAAPGDPEEYSVEIRGLDVYDPTTGELRSSSTDDIAAWFLDTDYDGDAFFVRHAYFTGADDPYDRLRHALRADISDEAWATINATVSRPFPRPRSGKIAIKVINHYGDEVLKVLSAG